MLEALVAGVRDPALLAELAKGRLRPKIPLLREALAGNFDQRHGVIVAECLAHLDGIDQSVGRISAEIAQLLEPHRWAIELLVSIPGVQLRTAEVVIAEIGSDMSVFPMTGHRRPGTWPPGPGFARVTILLREKSPRARPGPAHPGCKRHSSKPLCRRLTATPAIWPSVTLASVPAEASNVQLWPRRMSSWSRSGTC
jgi:hypothetical protein